MSKFEPHDLQTHVDVWIRLASEKQQHAITAHCDSDTSYWSHELLKLISLKEQLGSGKLVLMGVDKSASDDLTVYGSPFPEKFKETMAKIFNDTVNTGFGIVEINKIKNYGTFGKHHEPISILATTPNRKGHDHFQTRFTRATTETHEDQVPVDKRKLRDAIAKVTGLSIPATTRIVCLHRDHSAKDLVFMALQQKGRQLAGARDRFEDADWYANHHISRVLNQVEMELGFI